MPVTGAPCLNEGGEPAIPHLFHNSSTSTSENLKRSKRMNRQQFLNDEHVQGFIWWAAKCLPAINVHILISPSGTGKAEGKRGPGVNKKIMRFDQIVESYHWRSVWTNKDGEQIFSDDWPSSLKSLNMLSKWIRDEVDQGSNFGALAAAKAIVQWGGDIASQRTTPKGAIPFLQSLENLCAYFAATRSSMQLDHADIHSATNVLEMNAMLTKVHALLSVDGLPIYDSRVAGAIGVLVERYRQSLDNPWTALPELLTFRATDRANVKRRVIRLSDRGIPVLDPGVMDRQNKPKCARDWASAKVRLAWLLVEILNASDKLGNPVISPSITLDGSLTSRMHAFEAGLFMLGFDVDCLHAL